MGCSMTTYPAPMLRIIRRRSRIVAIKQAVRFGYTASKGLALGAGLYLTMCFVLGQ